MLQLRGGTVCRHGARLATSWREAFLPAELRGGRTRWAVGKQDLCHGFRCAQRRRARDVHPGLQHWQRQRDATGRPLNDPRQLRIPLIARRSPSDSWESWRQRAARSAALAKLNVNALPPAIAMMTSFPSLVATRDDCGRSRRQQSDRATYSRQATDPGSLFIELHKRGHESEPHGGAPRNADDGQYRQSDLTHARRVAPLGTLTE